MFVRIKFFTLGLLFLLGPRFWAADLSLSYSVNENTGLTTLYSEDTGEDDTFDDKTLSVLGTFKNVYFKNTELSIGVDVIDTDYSQFELRDKEFEAYTLGETRSHVVAKAGVSYNKGRHEAALSAAIPANSSPYTSTQFAAKYSLGFFNKTTVLDFAASAQRNKRPVDFYLDINTFEFFGRPQTVHNENYSMAITQVFSKYTKGKLTAIYNPKNEERVGYWGFDYTQYISLTDRLYTALSYGQFDDFTNQTRQHDLGYFKSQAMRAKLSYEAIYDLWLSASYTYSNQTEDNDFYDRRTILRSDIYEASVNYQFDNSKIELSYYNLSTDRSAKRAGASFALTWNI